MSEPIEATARSAGPVRAPRCTSRKARGAELTVRKSDAAGWRIAMRNDA